MEILAVYYDHHKTKQKIQCAVGGGRKQTCFDVIAGDTLTTVQELRKKRQKMRIIYLRQSNAIFLQTRVN